MTAQFCSQCGAALEASARFCTECGAPQTGQRPPAPARVQTQTQTKFPLPVILLIAGVLLLAGGGLFYFLGQPDDVPAAATAPPAADSDIPHPEVVRISVEESKELADAGTAVIVDVRPFEDYQTLHAANAISIPLSELPDRYGELSPDSEILTYCT